MSKDILRIILGIALAFSWGASVYTPIMRLMVIALSALLFLSILWAGRAAERAGSLVFLLVPLVLAGVSTLFVR